MATAYVTDVTITNVKGKIHTLHNLKKINILLIGSNHAPCAGCSDTSGMAAAGLATAGDTIDVTTYFDSMRFFTSSILTICIKIFIFM